MTRADAGPLVMTEDVGFVRVLTLNRPAKLNALDFALTRALLDALRAAGGDSGVRCVVLTGAGRAFCAGADTTEFAQFTGDNAELIRERASLTASLHAAFPALRIPAIAAVNGLAIGGGAGLALSCDFAVAAPSATFAYPEVKHGMVPAIVMAGLVRAVGSRRACELTLTARTVDAAEALRIGMVTSVATDGNARAEAIRLAMDVEKRDPEAIAATKALVHRVADLSAADGLAAGRTANERMRAGE